MADSGWKKRSAVDSVEETASTASVMRVMNERALFERIRLLGPVSRPQLSEATGLSKPTISLALANLERTGLVRHVGQSSGNSGRAALLYEMRPEAGWVVGVDVGRSWLRMALANLAGEVVLRRQERSQSRDAKKLVAQIGSLVSTLPVEAGLSYQDVTYTVIGSPGVVDERSGAMRLAANLSGWEGSSVLDTLGDRLGSSLAVENDINLAALGEQAHGLGKGVPNYVFISVGTGIGMGIVLDGQLHRGARGAAGEIGFLPLGEAEPGGGEASKRSRGSLESVASAEAVVANARRLGMRNVVSAKQVFESARQDNKAALAAIKIEAEHLARGVAAITAVLDPELVVLGGGIGRNGDLLIAPMSKRLEKLLPLRPPPLMVSALGDDAVVLGALAIALARAREKVFARAMLSSSPRDPGLEQSEDLHAPEAVRVGVRERTPSAKVSARPDRGAVERDP
jgi:predicted NBD/HSP70 family sugar kinase